MSTECVHPIGFGGDCIDPDWDHVGEVHDWRNYINDDLRRLWRSFSHEQRLAIANNAEDLAGREEWD